MVHRWLWGAAAGAGGLVLVAGIGVGVFVSSAFRGPKPAMAALPGVSQSVDPARAVQSSTVTPSAEKPAPHDEPRRAELEPDALFAHASPSVVRIVTRDEDFHVTGFGSGFFISKDGLIVTNYHVIRGAVFASVVPNDGGTLFVEGLLASDPKADLALLKVSGSGFPALPVGAAMPP
jgi:S1-C subfamily serine protease